MNRVNCALIAASAAALVLPSAVIAQGAELGGIRGTITDSIHGRPLAGALVLLTRTASESDFLRTGVSDGKGRYRFDSLAAGHYAIAFETPLLDSLKLTLPPRELTLASGQHADLDLGLPSAARLRSVACPGVPLTAGQGAVVGRLTNADTDRPLAGATVAVSFIDLVLDQSTLRASSVERSGAVRADSLGRYRLCGVPTGTYLLMQVRDGSRGGSALRLVVDDTIGVVVRDLSLSASAARPLSEAESVVTRELSGESAPLTGTATLSGVVRGSHGEPLANAQVRVLDALPRVLTDSLGRFTLDGLPAGTQQAQVRRIGYLLAQEAVELRSGRTVHAEFALTRIVSLDSVLVTARRVRYREFDERARHAAFGRFLTEEQIMERRPFSTSDLLRTIPGFRIMRDGAETHVVSSRGIYSLFGGACETNVVIDRIPHQDIDLLPPSAIAGMEIYPGGSGAPPQYQSSCGVIIIWTK